MVAESTEILRPMTQFGCAHACSGVTPARRSTGVVRNGPPDAVSRMRRAPERSNSPALPHTKPRGSDWNTAECSLSTGSSVPPPSASADMKRPPDITSASLLASSTVLPARAAAMAAGRPAAPTMAAITMSTSCPAATSSSAAGPWRTWVASPLRRMAASRRSALAASAITAWRGRCSRHCSSSTASFLPAASATTSNSPRWRAMTSSVLAPMEPVEPRMAMRLVISRPPAPAPPPAASR